MPMKKRFIFLVVLLLLTFGLRSNAAAQTYYFQVNGIFVHVYWEADGTATIDYLFDFTNSSSASPIDYVDVGIPNANYSLSNVSADVEGYILKDIGYSPYVDPGVAIGLGSRAIAPGQRGKVHVVIRNVERVLFQDDRDSSYASAVFSPTWFGSQYVYGETRVRVTFHLPPGVKADEPRWHAAPYGWQAQPITGFDDQNRVQYIWEKADANAYTQYKFGASFPKQYVPSNTVSTPSLTDRLGISEDDLVGMFFCFCFGAFFIGLFVLSNYNYKKRQMEYLPPKIRIEGHGIKRGLTAIEAAVLMEQPVDKILTMILFAVIKKGAAQVEKADPMEIRVLSPIPEDLRQYEREFLDAFTIKNKQARQKALRDTFINLVNSVAVQMKGFSRKETVEYYKKITEKAWKMVEDAATPEVVSQKYDEVMEWTMLDKNYTDRTRDIFQSRPVVVPRWWGHYDPTYRPISTGGSGSKSSTPAMPAGGGSAMPTLPGGQFAASVVGGMQSFAGNVIGNVSAFTSAITGKTNPIPQSSSGGYHSSGGGSSCACACACAGCACACAGGGR
ncbi:MAG: hypothetical protein OHK0052_27390 [Anaerolineales bacterium]